LAVVKKGCEQRDATMPMKLRRRRTSDEDACGCQSGDTREAMKEAGRLRRYKAGQRMVAGPRRGYALVLVELLVDLVRIGRHTSHRGDVRAIKCAVDEMGHAVLGRDASCHLLLEKPVDRLRGRRRSLLG
jgi:hypothetical protein